ncbi:hypothetical protein [Acuticoccus mangrovi]|uniref:Uncharacterized protein n=1 Tax=Acuticoccus mangrovi TaxID=2796142 RepID=A0A934IT25_9HYPH|nr:hypothetical protein [Acuticoccus mangrovi]MBJ3778281.1 hypothetical protein [Acuticoccus mangrovi]
MHLIPTEALYLVLSGLYAASTVGLDKSIAAIATAIVYFAFAMGRASH